MVVVHFMGSCILLFADVIFALSSKVKDSLKGENLRMTTEDSWNSGPTCVEVLIISVDCVFQIIVSEM